MSTGETTTVHRLRTDHRLQQLAGYAWALSCICDAAEECPTHSLRAVVDALTFSLEQLCQEHGLSPDGRRA